MTRRHRFAHRIVWPVLGVIVLIGVTMALALRPPPDQPSADSHSGQAGKP